MAQRITGLGFEAMENRVVLSASVWAMDFHASPYLETREIVQDVDHGTTQRLTDKGFGFVTFGDGGKSSEAYSTDPIHSASTDDVIVDGRIITAEDYHTF